MIFAYLLIEPEQCWPSFPSPFSIQCQHCLVSLLGSSHYVRLRVHPCPHLSHHLSLRCSPTYHLSPHYDLASIYRLLSVTAWLSYNSPTIMSHCTGGYLQRPRTFNSQNHHNLSFSSYTFTFLRFSLTMASYAIIAIIIITFLRPGGKKGGWWRVGLSKSHKLRVFHSCLNS